MDEIMMLMFLAVAVMFSYFWFNTYRRIGLLRRFSSRNWGILMFRSHGRSIFPVVVDFDKDVLHMNDGIWILDKGKIYRQVGDEKSYRGEFDPKKASFNQGCPIMYVDLHDVIPLGLESEEDTPAVARNPLQIEATLRKERAAIEAEAIHMKEKEFKRIINLVYVVMIIGAAAVIIAAYDMMQVNQLGAMMASYINTAAVAVG